MKRRIFALAIVLFSIVLILTLLSCNEGGGETTPKEPNNNVQGDGNNSGNDDSNNDNNNNNGGGDNNGGDGGNGTETHTHTYGEWETVKAPTCKEAGERSRSCECGDKQTEALEVVAHVESEWIVDKEATATEKGTRRKECTLCGEKLAEEEMPATGSVGLAYEKNSDANTYTITGIGTCTETEIYIPEYINGGKVTAIDDEAFKGNKSITKVSIPGVYYIGESAFESCTALADLTFGYGVQYMGNYVFRGCTTLAVVELPSSLKEIPAGMFYECSKLQKIVIPSGVTKIGRNAFGECAITSLNWPASIKQVGDHLFGTDRRAYLEELYIEDIAAFCAIDFKDDNNAGLMDPSNPLSIFMWGESKSRLYVGGKLITANDTLVIPEGVTRIGDRAFRGYQYKSISIPSSVVSVGEYAFTQLFDTTISARTEYNGAYYFGNEENPYHILWRVIKNTDESYEIHPDTKIIANSAFAACKSLSSITIPESVEVIEKRAFYGCSMLSSVTISNPNAEVHKEAFWECTSLPTTPDSEYTLYENAYYEAADGNPYAILVKSKERSNVKIHPDTKIIYDGALSNITLKPLETYVTGETPVFIPDGVEYIGDSAFYKCSFFFNWDEKDHRLVIPDSVKHIGKLAFSEIGEVETIVISKNVEVIESKALKNLYNVRKVIIPEGVKVIGSEAFYDCRALESLILPEGLESIGNDAFYNGGKITELILPDSLKSIGDGAFKAWTSLLTVTVGKNVESIGEDAFAECKLITEIYNRSSLAFICGTKVHGEIAEFAKNVYSDTEGSKKLYTQDGYLFYVDGETAIVLKYTGDATELVLPEKIGTTTVEKYIIGEGAFKNNNTLESIILPENVVQVNAEAFMNCKKAKKIVIPEGVTQIGKSAFSGCSAVTELILPEGLLIIGEGAFSSLSSLTQLELPKTLVSIGRSAFSSCSKLTSVVIPDSVTEIGKSAFHGCSKLTSIKLSSNITTLNSNVFYGTKLTELVIPEGVTTICKEAFYWGTIPRVVIPVSVTSIEERAFYDTLINELVFEGTVEQWEAIEKSEYWATRNYTVICTNGTVNAK